MDEPGDPEQSGDDGKRCEDKIFEAKRLHASMVAYRFEFHGLLQYDEYVRRVAVIGSAAASDSMCLHDKKDLVRALATEPGTGGIAAEKGRTSLGGKLPVNPSGGLKAKGHPIGATGAAQVAEIVTHLRREAGPRQSDHASDVF